MLRILLIESPGTSCFYVGGIVKGLMKLISFKDVPGKVTFGVRNIFS
jgi:hypothetical protein